MKKMVYFWRKGLWTLISLLFVMSIAAGFLYLYLQSELPDVNSLNNVEFQIPLRIYTKDGKLIQEYGEKKSIPVRYDEIPKTLIFALIATEDQRFFEHSGVDVYGLGRAAIRMIKTGTKSQGGSTITMQVARNFFLSRKKTFLRKFNEILLAIKIDRELSKEKILELYFNRIYFGNRAYGVGAAANVYYGKPLKELNLAELAMLAGLPQAPSTQNPVINPIAAKKRRDHVLVRLLEEKYITTEQYQDAIHQPLTARYHGSNSEVSAPYVAEMIRASLYEHFGEGAYTKGYNVYTTIQSKLQIAGNQVLVNQLIAYDQRHGFRGAVAHVDKINLSKDILATHLFTKYQTVANLVPSLVLSVGTKDARVLTKQGQEVTIPWKGMSWARPALKRGWMGKAPLNAHQILAVGDVVYVQNKDDIWYLSQVPQVEAALVALNPNDGAIETLVGGFDFTKSKFNRVTQSTRQPGSSFKPFIYAAALNRDYTLATLINDAPIVVEDPSQPNLWRPHNVNLKFNGPTRLKEALVRSQNMVSIRILDDLGFDYAIDFVTHFGFQKKQLPRALALALGTLSVTPMDLTAAYAVFANGGYKIEPYMIDHITDNKGALLLQATPVRVCNDCQENSNNPSLNAPRVIPADIAFLMHSALKDVTQRGTAHSAQVLNRQDIAGKTGTTNDANDAWFAGYNSDLVVTTWVGFDQPQPLHEYAASSALPMWIDFMKIALKNLPEKPRPQPSNVITVKIDPVSGLLAKDGQVNAIEEYFRQQDVPTEESSQQDTGTSENPPNRVMPYGSSDNHLGDESEGDENNNGGGNTYSDNNSNPSRESGNAEENLF